MGISCEWQRTGLALALARTLQTASYLVLTEVTDAHIIQYDYYIHSAPKTRSPLSIQQNMMPQKLKLFGDDVRPPGPLHPSGESEGGRREGGHGEPGPRRGKHQGHKQGNARQKLAGHCCPQRRFSPQPISCSRNWRGQRCKLKLHTWYRKLSLPRMICI